MVGMRDNTHRQIMSVSILVAIIVIVVIAGVWIFR
jgi:hypothetical protein